MWACEHAGIEPDILCVAKGFTAGILPMAATLASERIFDGFRGSDERAFYYGHTYCGHPLGAAVAREVLAVYRDEAILRRARPKAERLAAALAAWANGPHVSEPRCLGMVAAFRVGAAPGYLGHAGRRVCDLALERGAYLRPLGDVVYLAPPLNIPEADLGELIDIVTDSLDAAARHGA
jgi:adenosylmethionine-8-amino-7-oxononanoate aminotransferase